MLVLAVAGQTGTAALSRVVETFIGAVTGVVVSFMSGRLYVQPAGDAIGQLAAEMAEPLTSMGEELPAGRASRPAPGRSGPGADRLLRAGPVRPGPRGGEPAPQPAPAPGPRGARVRVRRPGHPRARGRPGPGGHPRPGRPGRAGGGDRPGRAEPLVALGRLLVELGGGGRLRAAGGARGRRPTARGRALHIALEIARTHRDVLAEFMLVDARADLELWHIQGSLLANVDRLLREIDLSGAGRLACDTADL